MEKKSFPSIRFFIRLILVALVLGAIFYGATTVYLVTYPSIKGAFVGVFFGLLIILTIVSLIDLFSIDTRTVVTLPPFMIYYLVPVLVLGAAVRIFYSLPFVGGLMGFIALAVILLAVFGTFKGLSQKGQKIGSTLAVVAGIWAGLYLLTAL